MQEVYPLIASEDKQEDGIIYWTKETALEKTVIGCEAMPRRGMRRCRDPLASALA
jgi:hypothetical protein